MINSTIAKASPRILLLTDYRADEGTGPGVRLATTLRALSIVGEVTVVFMRLPWRTIEWQHQRVIPIDCDRLLNRRWRLYEMLRGWPSDSRYRNIAVLRQQIESAIESPPDLIWVFRARPYCLLPMPLENCPIVVDFDDLYDELYQQAASKHLHPDGDDSSSLVRAAWQRLLAWQNKLDSLRWRRLQQQIAARIYAAGVVSEADALMSGFGNAVVLPNGYPDPHVAHYQPPASCRMLMVGGYHYWPNATAARTLAFEVLPRVRKRIPNAELHLVGREATGIKGLTETPGVFCQGFVDSVDSWYQSATVAMTPLEWGAGSCIKVAEALAFRVPLVSTPFGIRGYDLADGQHVLLAADAEKAAEHVIKLFENPAYASALAERAYLHYKQRIDSPHCERMIAEVALDAMSTCRQTKR